MKHLFTSLLFFAGLQIGTAQLTQANHAPANGDMYDTWQCDSTNISLGGSGAGVLWNYASIATRSSIVNSYTGSTANNTVYPQANVFLSAGAAMNGYYKSTAANLEYYGGNVVVGNVAAGLTYTSPVISAVYPMNLNTTTTSVTGGSINITSPLPVTGTFTGSAMAFADASGTINLPGGTTYTNVLRVITSQTINFVTIVGAGSLLQVNYEYFGGGIKSPVFAISTSTANTTLGIFTQTLVTRYKTPANPPNAISESEENAYNYLIYPNPAADFMIVSTNNALADVISISDVAGREIESYDLKNGLSNISLNAYRKGVYFYTIRSEEGKTLRTGKLLIID